jgi:negative regulator of replication initiation
MVKKLKTFNLDEEIYNQFSQHCKSNGISMSKQIENFLKQELDKLTPQENPPTKKEEHPLKKYC